MLHKSSYSDFTSDELTLYAVGLADEELELSIQTAIQSDVELASNIWFLQVFSSSAPEINADHFEMVEPSTDEELCNLLRQAFIEGNTELITSAIHNLIKIYGGDAKALIKEDFKEIEVFHEVMGTVLLRVSEEINKFDESQGTLRLWFLTLVNQEAVTFLKRKNDEKYSKLKVQVNEDKIVSNSATHPNTNSVR